MPSVVLGLDPGSRHFGWGVVSKRGTQLIHLAHGVMDLPTGASLAVRLVALETALDKIIAQFQPQSVGIESIFFAKDAQAAAKLGHARGVALLVAARAGLPISEYAPALVKRATLGHGRADKTQIGHMVRALLRLDGLPRADASDALAVAITHLHQLPMVAARAAAPSTMGPLSHKRKMVPVQKR